MVDTTNKEILSVVATTSQKLKNLPIKNGQLIFIQDKQRIALDYNHKRTFYNQIEIIETESERRLLEPINGLFYFVIETTVLWTYHDTWIPLTTPSKDVIFIGTPFPSFGVSKTLYIDKISGISIWDDDSQSYSIVADKTELYEVTDEDIESLF